MIYSTSEHPQYVGVSSTGREMKDRFVYRNKNQKTETLIQIVFLKKTNVCYLLYIFNKDNLLSLKISKANLTAGARFVFSPNPLLISHLKIRL